MSTTALSSARYRARNRSRWCAYDDSPVNPTWAQDAGNDTDAHWGIVYNFTDAGKDCLCFIELGGPVDMTAGALTVTINASGMLTITRA